MKLTTFVAITTVTIPTNTATTTYNINNFKLKIRCSFVFEVEVKCNKVLIIVNGLQIKWDQETPDVFTCVTGFHFVNKFLFPKHE